MKVSKILRRFAAILNAGGAINKRKNPDLYADVKNWLTAAKETEPRYKTYRLVLDLSTQLFDPSRPSIRPNTETHQRITEWLVEHANKATARRMAARANMEKAGVAFSKPIGDWPPSLATSEGLQERVYMPRATTERVITREAMEKIEAAAGDLADRLAKLAPAGCGRVVIEPAPESPSSELAAFAADLAHGISTNLPPLPPDLKCPERPRESPPIYIPGPDTPDEGQAPDKWHEGSETTPQDGCFEAEYGAKPNQPRKPAPVPNTWYSIDENTPQDQLPEHGARLLVEDGEGRVFYAVYSGYLNFYVHRSITGHGIPGGSWLFHKESAETGTGFVKKFLLLLPPL